MSRRVVIRSHEYYDSVRLMQVSESVRKLSGVQEAILMMATVNNKKLLDVAGLLTPEITEAAADDLVVAIVADDDAAADSALGQGRTNAIEGIGRGVGLRASHAGFGFADASGLPT